MNMFIIDLIVKMCEHNHQSDLISLSFRTRCLLRQDIFRGKGPGTLFNFRDISWTWRHFKTLNGTVVCSKASPHDCQRE